MNSRFVVFLLRAVIVLACIVVPSHASGYEVWMGTLGWQQGMHETPEQWANTAALVEGLNVNWARGQDDPNRLNRDDRAEVIAMFTKAKLHASQVVPHGDGPITAQSDWQRSFDLAQAYGYTLEYLYTYSSGPGKSWKPQEHETLRAWLDANDHADVKIAFNARSGHDVLERPVIDGNGIECDLTSWKENKGNRHELLRWMADPNNPATQGEKIVIHCHLNFGKVTNREDLVDVWAAARMMVRDIGRDVMNTPELKEVFASDRLVFAFFGGDWSTPEISLLPETLNDTTYAESYTGLLLSLIEQRPMFEAETGAFPTDEQCHSFARELPTTPEAQTNAGANQIEPEDDTE